MSSYQEMFLDHLSEEIIKGGLSNTLLGCRIKYFRTIPSTMDEAHKAAMDNAPEGTLVVADEQTSGRGRLQRTWISPPGVNLYLSLILRPSTHYAFQLPMVSSLALARALNRLSPNGTRISIKWPNDVRIGEKKIGGILIENFLSEEAIHSFSIVGIGVNVNFDPGEYLAIRDLATSLQIEVGHPVPRLHLLMTLMEEMEELYSVIKQGGSVMDEWSSLLDTLGQEVRVSYREKVYDGYALCVDKDGSLVLRLLDGTFLTLSAGEVTLRA